MNCPLDSRELQHGKWITATKLSHVQWSSIEKAEEKKKQKRSKRSNVENHLNFDSCENISSSFFSHFFLREVFCFTSELASHVQSKTVLFAGVGRNIHDIWIIFFLQFLSFFTKEKQKSNKKEMFCNSLFMAIQQFQRLVQFDDALAALNSNKNASTSINERRERNRSEEEKWNAAIQCEEENNTIVRKIKSKVNWYSLLLLARLPDSNSSSTRRYSHEILLFFLRSRLLFNAK